MLKDGAILEAAARFRQCAASLGASSKRGLLRGRAVFISISSVVTIQITVASKLRRFDTHRQVK